MVPMRAPLATSLVALAMIACAPAPAASPPPPAEAPARPTPTQPSSTGAPTAQSAPGPVEPAPDGAPPLCLSPSARIDEAGVLARHGIDPEQLCEESAYALVHASAPPYQLLKAAKAHPELRARAVKDLGPVIEKMIALPSFAARFRHERALYVGASSEQVRPPRPVAELKKQRNDEAERQFRELREQMQSAPPEVRAAVQKGLEEARANHERWKNDPQTDASLAAEERERYEREKAQAAEGDAGARQRAEQVPADVKAALRKRIDELIALADSVSFDAKLVDRHGKKAFADDKLEAKPSLYKMTFRAGRPLVDEARAFARSLRTRL